QENRRLQKENEALREQLVQYKEMETTLRNALISSQKISETIVASAKSQAQALLEEARLERARARMKSDELPDALRQEIRALTEARDRLRADMAHIIRVHEALLEKIPRAERVLDKPEEDDSASSRAHFVSISDETEESEEATDLIRSATEDPSSEKNTEREQNAEESPFEKLD
ncbi:MAG TPA: DivIVA domain-containing protein, partial [Candidatus Hydrogenedentes bacterium]|nr:DivIVA domain-containing protein [Candidatus Hydrogenedentota bacterium]